MLNRIVSHYRILGKLGDGGMGVVYRAEDLNLGRETALKFLPEELTRDASAIERFEREARLAAAINHPNICIVYDVGEFNSIPFLAMELLEGETLKECINGSPIPVEKLLDWTLQILAGLEVAHARGILHCDLKSANLFITTAGQVKILDFGLAKLRLPRKAVIHGGFDHTATAIQTDPGVTIGTPAYMSPEQAQGEELDARSDLFSLGVVLYEMATGKLPFEAPNPAALITSLLRDSPRPALQLNPELPDGLERVITKALEKDPDARYQTAAELRGDLKRIQREMDSGQTQIAPLSSFQPANIRRQKYRTTWLFAAIASVLLAAVIAALAARPVPSPRVLSTTQITKDRRSKSAPFLTDGSRLYFNTGSYLTPQPYQVSTEGGDSVPVPLNLPNSSVLDLSRDGSELLVGSFGYNPYAFNEQTLWLAPAVGGSPRRLGNLVVGDAAWSPDGRQLAFTKIPEKEIDIAASDGTVIRKLVTVPGRPSFPRWSPDGKRIRFSLWRNQIPEHSLWEVSADGSHLHALFPTWRDNQRCGNWTRDGRYFVFEVSSKDLVSVWVLRDKRRLLEFTQPLPVQLTIGPMDTYAPVPSVDGQRVFVGGRQPRIEVVRYDATAKAFIPFLSGTSAEALDFSRNGKWVAYISYPGETLWRSTVNGEQKLQLTTPPLHASVPQWSPDGKRITFMADRAGGTEKVYVINADGSGLEQVTHGENNSDPTWGPDGKSIAFGGYPIDEPQTSHNMAIQIIDLATRAISVVPHSTGLWAPRWSPDGRYISALSADTQTTLLYDLQSQTWTELAKANFGYERWSRDSAYIGFDTLDSDPGYYKVWIRDRRVERIVSLKSVQRRVGAFGAWTGLTPDGSPLIARDASFDEIYALDWDAP